MTGPRIGGAFRCLLALILALAPAAVAGAQTAGPIITSVYPAGGERGTTVQVVAMGQNLGQATAVSCTNGVTAKVVSAKALPSVKNRSSQTISVNSVATLSLVIPPEARIGLADLRLVTPGGVSNRVWFDVGELPEVTETQSNTTFEKAEALPELPLTVNGQLKEGGRRDFFRFAAKAGQTIVCRVQARALLPYIADAVPGWNDMCLTLYEAGGREMMTVDDNGSDPDPVLVFQPPHDGDYVLEARDVLLRGREDWVYRLSVGELPQVTQVFPLGGRRGSTTKVHLWGVNLPTDTLDVPLAENSPNVLRLRVPGKLSSNEFWFAAGDYAEVLATPSHSTSETAEKIDWPAVINGRIDHPGQVDCYRLAVQKGQTLLMETQGCRLRSPVDSLLTLLSPKGQQAAQNDDFTDPDSGLIPQQLDSRLIYTFTTSGNYCLQVRDTQGKGGPAYGYRLIVAPARPDFVLRVMPENLRVSRGDTAVVRVQAVRKDGFDKPIRIMVGGLPPGAVASQAEILPGRDRVALTISVPADAPLGVVSPSVSGAADVGGQTVVRAAGPAEEMSQAFSYKHILPTQELALAVVSESSSAFSAFTLTLSGASTEPIEVVQGGQTEVRVHAVRPPGDPAVITLRTSDLGPGLAVKLTPIEPADSDETVIVTVNRNAPVGRLSNLILAGTTRAGKETLSRTLPAITVRVLPAPPGPPAPPSSAKRPSSAQPASSTRPAAARQTTSSSAQSARPAAAGQSASPASAQAARGAN
jgi:hypothetical protein